MATTTKKQEDNKNTVGTTLARLVGAAVVVTMVLKNDKSRGKVKKALINVKDQAIDYVDTLKTELNPRGRVHVIRKVAPSKKTVGKKYIKVVL